MNTLLLNRDGFQMPADPPSPKATARHAGGCVNGVLLNRDFQMPDDGWYQVAPLGEFAHVQAGLVQVVDPEACAAMVNRFADEAKGVNFAGLLVDFDHFSLDGEKRSEAAGWITALEARCQGSGFGVQGSGEKVYGGAGLENGQGGRSGQGGLFAKIRWSDVGEEAVKGGRYRFLSPVWARSDCVDLGNGRVRRVRLLNAAVTNDPNLKGMRPLSNNGAGAAAVGAAVGEPRFKWVLGETPEGRHCPSCTAVAGQVHTMAEWDAGKVKPGAATLCCQGNCKCRLEPTGDAAGGVLKDVPVRKPFDRLTAEDDVIENGGGGAGAACSAGAPQRRENGTQGTNATHGSVANTGWTNEARAASLAVRRAKTVARGSRDDRLRARQQESMDKASRDYEAIYDAKGLDGMTAEEVRYMAARVSRRMDNGSALTATEQRFVREMRERGQGDGLGGKEKTVKKAEGELANAAGAVRAEVRTRRMARDAGGGASAGRAGGTRGDEAPYVAALVNAGWKGAAQVAARAVREAKARRQAQGEAGARVGKALRSAPKGRL